MFPPDQLETERLLLRRPRREDAPLILEAYATDPEVPRYMTWLPHEDLRTTSTFLELSIDNWEAREGHRPWVLEIKESAELIGMLGTTVDEHGVCVGYVLARPFWGSGLMTEALEVVCARAFDDPELHRVWAFCDIDNLASARVMEKVGMGLEGTLRRFSLHPNLSDVPRDCLCYALVR